MARARQFCERLVPELERFRHSDGRYPQQLSQLHVKVQPPRLLRRTEFYRAVKEGTAYHFTVIDYSRIFAAYDFDSRSGMWEYLD